MNTTNKQFGSVTATMLKRNFTEVLHKVDTEGAVMITRYGKTTHVLLRIDEYEKLIANKIGGHHAA